MDYTGRTAWTLFPADLEMAEKYLQNCPSIEKAEQTAQRIINHTDLSMVAWDCVCQTAKARKDTMRMVMAKYQYLRLNRYRAEVYEDFSAMIEAASANCTEDEMREYLRLASAVIQQMEEVREQTSPLAYRIVDKPELDFMEEVTARLNHVVEKG